jgi:hypothetical protein
MSCGYIANVDYLATIFMIEKPILFNTSMHLITAGEGPIENFYKIDESK